MTDEVVMQDILPVLNKLSQALKNNNFDNIYSRIPNNKKGLFTEFFIRELGINPLRFMTVVPTYYARGSENISGVTIPSNITSIEAFAFMGSSIQSVNMSQTNIKTFGRGAFLDCSNLISVYLPNSLREIPEDAFKNCTLLQQVNLPPMVQQIGRHAFNGCDSVKIVTQKRNVDNPLRFSKADEQFLRQHLTTTEVLDDASSEEGEDSV